MARIDSIVSSDTPDPAILAACRRGERAALESVLRAHAPAIERVIARLVGPGADLEDLAQATFVAAIEAFPRFRGEASVRTWLTRIAVHVVHDFWKQPARRRRVTLEVVHEPADLAPPLDHAFDTRKRLERLYQHLDRIKPNKRLCFILHVLEGRPIEEVAALVGASRVATKSRIFLARRELLARVRKDPALADLLEEVAP